MKRIGKPQLCKELVNTIRINVNRNHFYYLLSLFKMNVEVKGESDGKCNSSAAVELTSTTTTNSAAAVGMVAVIW